MQQALDEGLVLVSEHCYIRRSKLFTLRNQYEVIQLSGS